MEKLPNDWDNLQKSLGASVLQSRDWADVQQQMGRQAFFAWSNHWSFVGFERKSSGLRYLLVPYGPTCAVAGTEAIEAVLELAKKQKFDFVRIEPTGATRPDDLARLGAVKVAEFDPEYTLHLDLTKTEEELRSKMNSGHRNLINEIGRAHV